MVKILTTISPQTEKLEGIDACRINCAFGTRQEIIALARKIMDDWGCQLLLDLPTNRKKTKTNTMPFAELIDMAREVQPNYVGISYVKSWQDVKSFKDHFAGTKIEVVAKVETAEAMEDLDRIIAQTDLIMIDRGDLATAIGIGKLSRAQKKIVQKCNKMNKRVIVATEFLMSMIDRDVPTKAEVVDIGNAISDGADYVMLSEETAVGKYSQHAVDVIREIVKELEDSYKVLLLSAGASPGMGALTATHHTSLVDLDGITILEAQLSALADCGVQDEDIIIATGKGDELIREFVHQQLKKTDISLVFNPWYKSSNMLITLWTAREYLRKGFIVIYGDVVFDSEILRRVIKNQQEIVLAVEQKQCDEEDEKICVKDQLMTLPKDYERLPFPKHKCIPLDEAFGEFIGLAKFNRWGATILLNEMDKMIRKGNPWAYLMEAFEHLVQRDRKLFIENITGLLWNDNDTIHDLKITKEKMLPLLKKYRRRVKR